MKNTQNLFVDLDFNIVGAIQSDLVKPCSTNHNAPPKCSMLHQKKGTSRSIPLIHDKIDMMYPFFILPRLCDEIDISNTQDLSNLHSLLAGNFEGVVQYNRDNRAFEVSVSI